MAFLPIILILFGFQTRAFDRDSINLLTGETRLVPNKGQLMVPAQPYFKVGATGNQLRIFGQKKGYSVFRSGKTLYRVNVINHSQAMTLTLLGKLQDRLISVNHKVERGEIITFGELASLNELQLIAEQCRANLCDFINQVKLDKSSEATLRKTIFADLTQKELPIVRLSFSPHFTATVPENLTKAYEDVLLPYGFEIKSMKNAETLKSTLKLQLLVAEIKKTKVSELGLNWQGKLAAGILPDTGDLSQLFVSANFLEQSGFGRVLASPTLLARDGEWGEFHSGGELPLRTGGRQASKIEWKKYGILLKFKPIIKGRSGLSLEIESEISTLESLGDSESLPSFNTHRVSSQLDLSGSRLILLSGLIREDQINGSKQLKGLGDLPLLGSLFRSRDFIEKKTELLVFIKPTVLNPWELTE